MTEAEPDPRSRRVVHVQQKSGSRARRIGGGVLTAAAVVFVYLSLVLPDQITRLPPGNPVGNALVRIPIEGVIIAAVLLALPERARRIVATLLGGLLGLLTIVKIVDIGFYDVLAREFDPVLDWPLLADGYAFLRDAIGGTGALLTAIGVVLLCVVLLVGTALAFRRLARLLGEYARPSRHTVFALTCAWVALSAIGTQIVGGIPVASYSAVTLARDTALNVPRDIADQKNFEREVNIDAFRDVPGRSLLGGLNGDDVIVGFVESYGRSAIENPEFNGPVLSQLKADDAELASAGYTAHTGYLVSSTAGGGSWLAHSTFLSGLWIDNQQRYRSLVSGDRLTLTKAFKNAGYRTVGVEPGVTYAWPEASFYGYDKVWDSHSLGYAGPSFSWSTMPDQFVLRRFQDLEYARRQGPLLAEITLTSSHTPWTPVPATLDWDKLGDGSVYGPIAASQPSLKTLWSDGHDVRLAYARSIAYSVDSLVSYVKKYGDDNLVLVFLGDHQPASVVVGDNASHEVPITIVAKDPKVLKSIQSWGWTPSLVPAADAPQWRMDEFRDKFLTTFSPDAKH